MLEFSPALAAHLAGGVTTLCRCWKLTRRDGTVMGFTDHDRDLTFEGVTFHAGAGLSASEIETTAGLQVSGGEVSGALSAADITEDDILAGRYDEAEVVAFIVNWSDVAQRHPLHVATIGEIRRADASFVAELRGPLHRYDEEQGRLYQRTCPAALGDARCGVNLAGLTITGTIGAGAGRAGFAVIGAAGYPEGWFAGGIATFAGGAFSGLRCEIRASDASGAIDLWTPLPDPPGSGDTVSLAPGCDKSFATCAAKFANTLNFRGFPHIPAPDFVMGYARSGEGGHDGGLLVG